MHIIVTTIQTPTQAMKLLSEGIKGSESILWVIGDRKGPENFELPNTRFFHIDQQSGLGFSLARFLPEKHYTRKNLGYLCAIREGAQYIVETDDDNLPRPEFFKERRRTVNARTTSKIGWCNAYRAFTDAHIWPRGLPLEQIHSSVPEIDRTNQVSESLIQQGLADKNPDVDAAYRLILPLPMDFRDEEALALGKNQWCPFNSQNTTFFKEAFPLLYLPSFCTFRMTDIWRSFVAQRCLWEMDSQLVFHSATVWQERNEHNLLRDFTDEIPGYLNNEGIRTLLERLQLEEGRDAATVCRNLIACYDALCRAEIVGTGEKQLVNAWVSDILSLISS